MSRKKKPSLYEELDVPANSSPATIKRAYRTKARKAHPDSGGTKEAFVQLKLAYEVLSDPDKRAKYDRDGTVEDEAPQTFSEAMGIVNIVLCEAVMEMTAGGAKASQTDLLYAMRARISRQRDKIRKDLMPMLVRKDFLAEALKRTKVKSGDGLLLGVIKHNLGLLEMAIAELVLQLKWNEEATRLLQEYTYDVDKPPPTGYGFARPWNAVFNAPAHRNETEDGKVLFQEIPSASSKKTNQGQD